MSTAATAGRATVTAGVLALQGDVSEHVNALRQAGAAAVREIRRPTDLDGVGALIIPGGESTTIGELMAEYALDRAVRQRVSEGMAVLGTCAGLILLATDIVGSDQPRLGLLSMTVSRNAYGRQVDSFETELEAPSLSSQPLPAVFIRAPRIERVEAGVDVLARHGRIPVLCQRERVLAASFHPELTNDRRLHRRLLGLSAGAAT